MIEVLSFTLAPLHRPGRNLGGGAFVTERNSLDFVINGRRLSEQIPDDVASCLGWGEPEWEALVLVKLLPGGQPDFPPDRVALYICPECGDLGCGAVSAIIEQQGESIIWRDFGWQNDYEDRIHRDAYAHLGPFRFPSTLYAHGLRSASAARPSSSVRHLPNER